MWKGVIELGSESVPVKLYAAARDASVHFHLIDKERHTRVSQRWVHAESGEQVAPSDVRKGYALRPDAFVVLEDDEVKALAPSPSREIEVTHVIARDTLQPVWFDRPYYLGPDTQRAQYAALVKALQARERDMLVSWVMRGKRYRGLARADGDCLMLFTLHAHDELVEAPKLSAAERHSPDKKEHALAMQLIDALQSEFDASALKSDYDERVRHFIEQKAKGRRPTLRSVSKKPSTGSLEGALKKSLQAARTHKPQERKSA